MDPSFLDRPEILEVIFPVAYSPLGPSRYSHPSLFSAPTYPIEVEKGIRIVCGFWVAGKECPSILYFHGNGETAAGHEWIAPLYTQRGINLFVADYRGYGSSDGRPTISNMLADAHVIFRGFEGTINKEGFRDNLFLMGRSLGSVPAIELAASHQEEIRGLIVESGAANNFRRLWSYLGVTRPEVLLPEESPFLNKVKIRQVRRPTLIIHGENDEVLPVTEGEELYHNSGAQEKRILIIPGAGHNDIMALAQDRYFDTIQEFIEAFS